jgi:type IV pilus assembly protein PilY1
MWSQVPTKGSDVDPNIESCESASVDGERQYRNMINIMDGKAPTVQLVDKNGDGKFDMANGDGFLSSGKYIGISRKKVTKGPHTIISTGKDQNVDIDAKNNTETLASMPEESLRPSWRQLR